MSAWGAGAQGGRLAIGGGGGARARGYSQQGEPPHALQHSAPVLEVGDLQRFAKGVRCYLPGVAGGGCKAAAFSS